MKKSLALVSTMTVVFLYGLLALICATVTVVCGGSVVLGLLIAVAAVLVQFIINPWLMDITMKWFYHADFQAEIPDYLREFIEGVCAHHGIKYPKIGVIDDGAPNAFTYGRTKRDARVLLTRGDFELLDEEEMKAVVGHELGHVAHYDMILMTVAGLVPMVFYGIFEACTNVNTSSQNSSGSKGGSKGGSKSDTAMLVIGLVALALYCISQLVVLWLSRTREYFADSFAGEVTGRPDMLASALVKIGLGICTAEKPEAEKGSRRRSAAASTTLGISDADSSKEMALFSVPEGGELSRKSIVNAMRWDLWNVWAGYYELFATHPLSSKRILALGDQAEAMGLEPYVRFDETKPESYTDDFAKDVAINLMPAFAFIVTVVLALINPIPKLVPAIFLFITFCAVLVKYVYIHPKKEFPPRSIESILGEVKVSGVTSIPCTLEGEIIGRGNPGCVFSEDFVVKDATGLVFADYKQPLRLLDKIFALFKNGENMGKTVTVKGWYRRSPVPYVELLSFDVDGVTKKCFSYAWSIIWRVLMIVLSAALIALAVMAGV